MSEARAQRLVDEYLEGLTSTGGHSVRRGIAQLLQHIADTECIEGIWADSVSASTLEALAADLAAPTLLDRAMAGDREAARQFLHEAGITDERGELLPQFRQEGE